MSEVEQQFAARLEQPQLKGANATSSNVSSGAVSTICGFCGKKVVISFPQSVRSGGGGAAATRGRCPDCNEVSDIALFFAKQNPAEKVVVADVVVFPAAKPRSRIELPNTFPARLENAIRDTELSFEAGLISPTLTCGRRALEGIFKHIQAEPSKDIKLFDLIENTLKTNEASKPLKDLAHAIRKGGNLGAHFDHEKDPDQESAELILALLEYLVSYFFLMPEKIKHLDAGLQKDETA